MIRLFAILLMLSAALPGLGHRLVSGPGGDHACGHSGCGLIVVETTCCGETIERSYCPMSGGPCRCAQSPTHDPRPQPDAPLPRTDRDSLIAEISVPASVVWGGDSEPGLHRGSARVFGLLAGRTHNEVQALLGVWRT